MNDVSSRVDRFLGIDSTWTRRPYSRRMWSRDGGLAALFAVYAVVSMETVRSLSPLASPLWIQVLWLGTACLSLVFRRAAPLTVWTYSIAHLMLTALVMPELGAVTAVQAYHFLVLFSTIAWARRRELLRWVFAVEVVALGVWIAIAVVRRGGLSRFAGLPSRGLLSPELAAMVQVVITTAALLGIAVIAGSMSWHSAQRLGQTQAQAADLHEKSGLVRNQAVIAERIRIARELHDVVGHYVAVIGIQAGAARRVLDRNPEMAKGAMRVIEQVSRSAAHDMQLLIGTLRSSMEPPTSVGPTLTDIPSLLRESERAGLLIEYKRECDDVHVPRSVVISIYRCVQESLTNIHKHSTAKQVSVTLSVRLDGIETGIATVHVLDDGVAHARTSGSGVGHIGMRDRTSMHGGAFHAGPTDGRGYAVDATFRWAFDDCGEAARESGQIYGAAL